MLTKRNLMLVGAALAGAAFLYFRKATSLTDKDLLPDDLVKLRAVPSEEIAIDTGETQADGSFVWEGHGARTGKLYAFRASAVASLVQHASGQTNPNAWDPATVPSPAPAAIFS